MSKFILAFFFLFLQNIWKNFFHTEAIPNFLLTYAVITAGSNFKSSLIFAIFCGILLDLSAGISGISTLSIFFTVLFILFLKSRIFRINFYFKIFLVIMATFLNELLFIFFSNFSFNYEIFEFKKIFQESILNSIFAAFLFRKC